METNRAHDTAVNLACVTNDYSSKGIKGVLEYMLNEHPTLQQMFTSRFIIPFIRKMAERYDNELYDPRNEAACKACKDMWEGLKQAMGITDDDSVYLPMI